jgi:(p)ppGpp synthase/HD superfamily hydrolase
MGVEEVMVDLTRIVEFVKAAHAGQTRKGLGTPFWTHPLSVSAKARAAGMDADAIAAALGHDVVEDTALTFADLDATGLFSPRSLALMKLLTKWWPDDAAADVKAAGKPLYYAAILADRDATDLKLLDRADNLDDMARLWAMPGASKSHKKWVARYLAKSLTEFAPFRAVGSPGAVAVYDTAMLTLAALIDPAPVMA